MDLAQLEKIISDGKAKHKAFDEADIALAQLKGLAQLEKETKAANEAALEEGQKLAKENAALKDKIDAANLEAAEIVAKAKAAAIRHDKDSDKRIADKYDKANDSLAALNAQIDAAKAEVARLNNEAQSASAKLEAINKELSSSQDRLKRLIG